MIMCDKLVLVIASVAALVVTVHSLPHPAPRVVDLQDVVNKTVCPIVVEDDVDPERVPRRIKMMRCAPNPSEFCVKQSIPKHECCAHNHNHRLMECVEIHDTVLVYYNKSNSKQTFDVAVGCTCMIENSAKAPELLPP